MGLTLNINKTGIKSQQLALNTISNNIANATTTGYKAKGVRFQSLLDNEITEEDVLLNDVTPSISAGVRSEVATTDFRQGSLRDGTSALNLAIVGEGFFGVENGAGELFLTKDGTFTMDGTGRLVNGNGHYLMTTGEQVNVYNPANVEALQPAGNNYYVAPNNDLTLLENPRIEANRIEQSNVDLAKELTNMMIAQRAYSLNVKVAQSTDDMMSLINQFSV